MLRALRAARTTRICVSPSGLVKSRHRFFLCRGRDVENFFRAVLALSQSRATDLPALVADGENGAPEAAPLIRLAPQAFDHARNALDIDDCAASIAMSHDGLELVLIDLSAVSQSVTSSVTQGVRVA
jgi:hypothetical protein